MPITFSGLATGLDTAALIESLVSVERIPITRLESQRRDVQTQKSRFEQLRAQLTDLRTRVGALDSRDEALKATLTSSDPERLEVSSLGASSPAEYQVVVKQLARAERTYSDAFAARDVAGVAGEGTLTIQVGSEDAVEVTVDATDTLESIIAKINASGGSVTAGLLYTGSEYRIQVSGTKTGAGAAIAFTEDGTLALGLDDPANEFQDARPAIIELDDFEIVRDENVVTGAIAGVSLTLLEESADPVRVRVGRDDGALATSLQAFVDAYNKVADTLNAEFAFTGQARLGGTLAGDSTLRTMQQSLRSLVSSAVAGAPVGFSTLASIGVESTSTGRLELDRTKLSEALEANTEGVVDLLVGSEASPGMMAQLDARLALFADPEDGLIGQRLDGLDSRVDDFDAQIERMELRLEKFEESLRIEYSALEQLVSSLQSQQSQMAAILSGG